MSIRTVSYTHLDVYKRQVPYLPIRRKLILPGIIMYKINVSIRNDLKLLFNLAVSLFKTSLQISLYWLSMLVLPIFAVFGMYYKDTDNQLLNLIFYVKLCYIKH